MRLKRSIRFNDKHKKVILVGALSAMMLLNTGFTSVKMPTDMHQVVVNVDGGAVKLSTNRTNPHLLLAKAGVKLNAGDEYELKTIDGKVTELNVYRAVPVTIDYQGEKKEIITSKQTVGAALQEAGYNLGDVEAAPGMDTKIKTNLNIVIKDSAAKIEADRLAREARERQVETSRGVARYSAVYTMEATAYLPTDGSPEGLTASGMAARRGVVAVDTDVIPLGTRLYIPGYGEAIAADTGGAIYGERIDLCMESYDECMDFGRRDVTVYVLD